MKNLIPFLLGLFLVTSVSARSMSIYDAEKAGLVKVNIVCKGSDGGPAMRALVYVENLTLQNIDVLLETGRTLIPQDPGNQTVIVAQHLNFKLNGRETQSQQSYVYCIQKSDGSPVDNKMALSKMADKKLVELAKYIEAHGWFSDPAQDAMWVLSDGLSINEVNGSDEEITRNMREYVTRLTGQQAHFSASTETLPTVNVHVAASDVSFTEPMSSDETNGSMALINGSLDVTVREAGEVLIAAYNSEGVKVADIRKFVNPGAGNYHCTFEMSSASINGPVTVKATQNGNTLAQTEVK